MGTGFMDQKLVKMVHKCSLMIEKEEERRRIFKRGAV